MIRTSQVILIAALFACLLCIIRFPARSEAGDKGRFFPGVPFAGGIVNQHSAYHDFLIPYPNSYGRRYLQHYYFHYPPEESSPYENLVVQPAGELHITAMPAHAKVFVDGYALEQNADFSFSIGLLTGIHTVAVRAEGFQPYQKEIEIETGKRTILSVALSK